MLCLVLHTPSKTFASNINSPNTSQLSFRANSFDKTMSLVSFDTISLGEIVLPSALKDMTESDSSTLNGFVSSDGGFINGLPQFVQSISSPIEVYVRTWVSSAVTNEIAIEAIETSSYNGALNAFKLAKKSLTKFKGSVKTLNTVSLPDIPDSVTMTLRGDESGVSITALQSIFVSRNIIFAVRMDFSQVKYSFNQLVQLSENQYQRAQKLVTLPPKGISTVEYLLGTSLVLFLILIIIFSFHLKNHRRRKQKQKQLNRNISILESFGQSGELNLLA